MEKPKFLTIPVPEPPAVRGAAEKIADMFMEMEEVSFARDIVPVIFEEFAYQSLEMRLCTAASGEVERAQDIARGRGYTMECVPQFGPSINGSMEVCDIVYKRAGWL